MEKKLKNYLKNHKISFSLYEHPAVFTVEESKKIDKGLPKDILHTKNLFLKGDGKNFYLVCMYAHSRLNMRKLKKILSARKLRFASEKELLEELNLTPGSVSIFGMIHARNVFLILDKKIWDAKKVGFHPNKNTATLEINHGNLKKFYDSLSSKKEIIELSKDE